MDNYNVEFQLADNTLYVTLTGKFPVSIINSSENAFKPLLDECNSNKGIKAIIIDICKLDIKLNTVELFRAGEDAAKLSNQGVRTALLARKETIDSFFDNVIFNRSSNVRVFSDKDAALKWLQE